jgi:hypothetical protein
VIVPANDLHRGLRQSEIAFLSSTIAIKRVASYHAEWRHGTVG